MHNSIALGMPCEFIDITPINPLISKCMIKVCYVSNEPNRNGSVISKETAKKLANSLPGSPIVGYYNETLKDFEEHNKVVEITSEGIKLKSNTRPYGFVDLGAKVWFQWFSDDGIEREYLVTEGYLWTGQYPEAQKIIEEGKGQSMELDDNLIDAYWSEDLNGNPKFFIINDAIVSKLCVLGDEVEPCFEGAQIGKFEFSLDDNFKSQLFSLMTSIKEILEKGGTSVLTQYKIQIGDTLWECLYENISQREEQYTLDGVYTQNEENFAILKDENGKFYRLNFKVNTEDDNSTTYELSEELIADEDYETPEVPMFKEEEVAAYEEQKEAGANKKSPEPEEPIIEEEGSEPERDVDEVLKQLQDDYSTLKSNYETLKSENESLKEFKAKIEKAEKQKMIDKFYMLSDEDKKDVIDNIDSYSLEDIESKLSVICVRNKVSFDKEEEKNEKPTSYSLTDLIDDDDIPEWVKAVEATEKTIK